MIISKPCVTMRGIVIGAYSWDVKIELDLKKVAECLKAMGYKVSKLIPDMLLIVDMEGYETSIYPSGKIIIKLLEDSNKGRAIARTVYECAGVWDVIKE